MLKNGKFLNPYFTKTLSTFRNSNLVLPFLCNSELKFQALQHETTKVKQKYSLNAITYIKVSWIRKQKLNFSYVVIPLLVPSWYCKCLQNITHSFCTACKLQIILCRKRNAYKKIKCLRPMKVIKYKFIKPYRKLNVWLLLPEGNY